MIIISINIGLFYKVPNMNVHDIQMGSIASISEFYPYAFIKDVLYAVIFCSFRCFVTDKKHRTSPSGMGKGPRTLPDTVSL